MKQEKDYFLLTLDETEEIAKEVIRLAKNVKTMHLANPDNPDIIEKASELQGKAEKLTLRARVLVMYSQAPDGKALSFKNTENVIPVELAISEDGWFCMRLPMLASKKMSRFDAGHFGPDKMHIIRNFGSLSHETIDIQSAGQEWWRVALIPFSVLDVDAVPATLRCNFYKCGDNCAIPHYLSWAPIDTPAPNFHCPEFFGEVTLTR